MITDIVFELLADFPNDERFGLVSQLSRSSVSIPSNVAEGCSRSSNKELARFIEIAIGSAFEVETQLEIACRRKYISEATLQNTVEKLNILQRKLNSFHKYLKNNT